jgi:hypothetical protein
METGTRTEGRQGVTPNILRFFLLILPLSQLLPHSPTKTPWQRAYRPTRDAELPLRRRTKISP